jgi:PAS domain S-box-containing protein
MSATAPITARAAHPLDFQSEQVRQLYAGVPAGPAGGALAGIVLTTLLWERVDRPMLLTWISGLLLVLLIGGLAGLGYKRTSAENSDAGLWLRRFRLAVAAAGIAWGLSSLLIFPSHDIAYQALFSVVLAGVAAGAVTAMAMDRVSALLFTVPLLLPLIVRLFVEDTGIFSAMGAILLIFLVYISMSAFRNDRSARQNIQLRQAQSTHLLALREGAALNHKLALAVAHIEDAVMIMNVQGQIEWVNPSFVRTTGYTLEEVAGRRPSEVLRGPKTDPKAAAVIDLSRQKRERATTEILNYAKDGRTFWTTVGSDVVRDENGQVMHFISVARDITQRKATEEALRVALGSAEAANQAKSDFLSSMSHELRTPLNAILGYAQLMEMRNDLPSDIMSSAHEIRHAGDHLLALVNDVLDLARIESGDIEMQLEALAPATLLAACQSQHQHAAEARQIRLVFEPPPSGALVTADRRRLLQVLNNLISNAIKYNREQGEVRVRCERSAIGIRFAVHDTGPGIPAAKQAQLFQPFNRLGAEMGPIEGTGIGLVITRQLVRDMHGTMGLESGEGRGSTFWVELPAADPKPALA